MAAANPSMVSGGDRRQGLGFPPRRQGAPQYVWTASAPSPAVVSELEALFPDIVQLPMAAIDLEAKVWSECGMIVRSLSRWVPPEAIVREFHRAGLAGRIETISLSHRSALIKFEFPTARDAALVQPWVVNGQPLAVAAWHSDFVPADDALTSALLWLRLPNLPIEYWSDETLSSIVAVAGQFVAVDAATKQRSRGGFARVCVRVELSRPLRPGARIRANGTPFWQSFVYEHVEGICYHCGSLHLTGPCASSLEPASSTAAPRFGPWMAALRHRKPASGAGPSSPMSSSVQMGDARKEPLGVDDGWMTPRKTARRRSQLSPLAGNVEMLGEGSPGVAEPCRLVASVPVTVASEHCSDSPSLKSKPREKKSPQLPKKKDQEQCQITGFKFSAMDKSSDSRINVKEVQANGDSRDLLKLPSVTGTVLQKDINCSGNQMVSTRKVATNPFGLLGSDRWAGLPKNREEANPVLPKRARPAEVAAPRVIPKPVKGKGKAGTGAQGNNSRGVRCSEVFLGDPQLPPLDSCTHLTVVTTLKEALLLPSTLDNRGDVEMESTQSCGPTKQGVVEESFTSEGPSGMDMIGSMEGARDNPQHD